MKGISKMPSLKEIKSIHSIGARSIPKVQRSSYLDLYVLEREKKKIENEIYALNKRKSTLGRQLDDINKRIGGLQKEAHQEQKIKTHRSVPTKPLKTMAVNY
ncbi:hypothetical protein KKG24_05180 [Patescibacteria group bacterium]|nr:hypothetical protein [Patescibacteria group bacterium]